MKIKEGLPGYEEKFEELTDLLSAHPQIIEIHERFDGWCDLNLDTYTDLYELEKATIDYLESLCLEYGVS